MTNERLLGTLITDPIVPYYNKDGDKILGYCNNPFSKPNVLATLLEEVNLDKE